MTSGGHTREPESPLSPQKTMYEKRLSSLDKQELAQLIKTLQKLGLCFAEGKLSLRTESDGKKSQ
jgi:hypothetical protein